MRSLIIAALLSSVSFAARHKFTLLSDVHYDPNYGTPNSFRSCKDKSAPPLGMPGCDAPLALVSSAFKDIAESAPADSHLIFTGDWLRHGIADGEAAETFRNLTYFVKDLPHKTIPAPSFAISSLGNNDFIPDYYFDIEDTSDSTVGLFGSLLREADLISDDENVTFAKAAFYSRDLTAPNLRFLVLNTLPYSEKLEPAIDPSVVTDPVGQFAWMEEQLADAAAKGMQVVLISHIPPTQDAHYCVMGDCVGFIHSEYIVTMRDLVVKYNDTIVYQFYGHAHEFSMLADESFPVPGIIVPSITKIFGNAASYMMAEYDDVTKKFLNFRMRFLDNDKGTWKDYTSASGANTLDVILGGLSTVEQMRATAIKFFADKAAWDEYTVIHAGGIYADMWPGIKESETVLRLRHTCSMLGFTRSSYSQCIAEYGNVTSAPSVDPATERDDKLGGGYIALIVISGVAGIGAVVFMFIYGNKHFNAAAAEATEVREGVEPLNTESSA